MTLISRVSLLAMSLLIASLTPQARAQEGSAATETEQYVHVLMKTSMGNMYIALDAQNAPISTENFLRYVDAGKYDGTVFHRVIPTFMIQGGGFEPDGTQRETFDPIKNEWQNGLKNERGTIAMARTSNPDSATSQFFINVVDNAMLDVARPQTGGAAYAVFGKVVGGMEVADAIRNVQTTAKRGMRDWPVEDVMITEVRRLSDAEVADLANQMKRDQVAALEAKIEATRAELEAMEAECEELKSELSEG
ncbi:MAG: peptidylprolyl isomerase [Phycisphaerales bacterium]